MRDFGDKFGAIPGVYVILNFCKTLAFMLLACLIVILGGIIGWGAGWLLASLFAVGFNADRNVALSVFPLVTGTGGLILAPFFLIPMALDRFYGSE